jgi:hypothetical protein
VLIKKKCPGGPSNDGTYYQLGARVGGLEFPYGSWLDVGATVKNNIDGTVTITIYRGGAAVATATDAGTGCAVIRSPGATGLRGDNAEFQFANFTVTPLA